MAKKDGKSDIAVNYPNMASALAVVSAASASKGTPRSSAMRRAVCTTNAGSHLRPRSGAGARNGESVSTSSQSAGTYRAEARTSSERLNVTIPEKETQKPRSSRRPAKRVEPV